MTIVSTLVNFPQELLQEILKHASRRQVSFEEELLSALRSRYDEQNKIQAPFQDQKPPETPEEVMRANQERLKYLRDRYCYRSNAELCRRIQKDPGYVSRLLAAMDSPNFQPVGPKVMGACEAAFELPSDFWYVVPKVKVSKDK